MPIYLYEIIDNDKPTGETVEIFQSIKDDALTVDPKSGKTIRRAIVAPSIKSSKPAWERCSDVRDHIRNTKPKWIHDKDKGIRERFDPKKHG